MKERLDAIFQSEEFYAWDKLKDVPIVRRAGISLTPVGAYIAGCDMPTLEFRVEESNIPALANLINSFINAACLGDYKLALRYAWECNELRMME